MGSSENQPDTPARQLSRYASDLRYADIPPAVRTAAVESIVDCLGIALATQPMPFARIVTDVVTEMGGREEATVCGSPIRIPAANAIIANGNMIHGMDFDDTHGEGMAHPAACIVPTALAVAERVGADGRAVIEAVVAGLEVQTRICSAASTQFHARGFHPTFVSGCFATALTAGKLLGLTPDQMTHALGICGTQASGTFEWLEDGSWAKRFGPGWAGHGGTIAALMAQRGYTGPATIFEGRFGLFRSHVGEGNYDLSRLLRGLGSEWETLKLINKRYPCCHATHAFLNAARTLRSRHGFSADDVVRVECRFQRQQAPIVCEPEAVKRAPATPYQAQFSIYHTVAAMLLRGEVDISDFSEASLSDPRLRALSDRVHYTTYEPETYNPNHPGTVVITLQDGRVLSQSYDDDVDNVMNGDDIDNKFRANARHALPAAQAGELLAALRGISERDDIRNVMAMTLPSGA